MFTIIIQSYGCGPADNDDSENKDLIHDELQYNHGITKDSKTIRIISGKSDGGKYLVIENPHINKINIRGKDQKDLFETGDILPFDQRPYPYRFFVFPIDTGKAAQTLDLTLDKSGENLSYTIKLLNKKKWEAYQRMDNIMIGSIIGFYGLAILLTFSLVLYYRDPKFIYFLLYITFSLAWILNDGGILYEFLWSNAPTWHKSSRGFFSSITMILFALYLNRNDNNMLTKGIRLILLILIGLMTLKFLFVFVVSKGLYPDSLKYISMHMNAIILLLLMGYVMAYLLVHLKKNKSDLYEILGILVYCCFVTHLSLKELGLTLINMSAIHHFDAMVFFPAQCLFMSVHLYKKEKERKYEEEKALIEYKIEQQRMLDKKILETEEKEKKRIAQNIHDEIGSVFVAMKYQALSLKERSGWMFQNIDLDGIIKLSEEGIKKQYSIIDDLLFEFKSGSGLKETLQDHMNLIVNREDLRSEFIFDADERRWTDFQKAQVFRIISELLTNTIKHGQANRIKLYIHGDKNIMIAYTDNGKGFNNDTVIEGRGLTNIKMRVNALNGKIFCDSGSNGTSYQINFELTHE